jgi:hypothetical protein
MYYYILSFKPIRLVHLITLSLCALTTILSTYSVLPQSVTVSVSCHRTPSATYTPLSLQPPQYPHHLLPPPSNPSSHSFPFTFFYFHPFPLSSSSSPIPLHHSGIPTRIFKRNHKPHSTTHLPKVRLGRQMRDDLLM